MITLPFRFKIFVGPVLNLYNSTSRNILKKSNVLVVRSLVSKMTGKSNFERLPKNVVPKHYTLSLTPNLTELIFNGTCTINVEVQGNTNRIILNAVDLVVSKAVFKDGSKNEIVPQAIEMCEEEETLQLSFGSTLPSGNGQLELEFQGVLNDKLKGFYCSTYTTSSGEKRFAACTQFEATDARRAFPCWDEPAIKATFDVTLIVPQDRVALSNMNVISDVPIDNLREVKYATSPIMSTYLLAFIVGEFEYLESKTSNGVLVRVYTPLEKKEQGRVALEASVKALEYYEDYFKITYPLPKLDLIALADFGSGAMENWGLVTYRETCLLVDPENSSASNKQFVAIVVAHELAHQWFGNLVTMEWWTHLWLNEGFASFIEFLCVDHLFPEYDIWTQFVTDTFEEAMKLDALDNSHPIEVPVRHPTEIREVFDSISYCKGSSVIRMLHAYIGDEFFRKGLNIYLNRHSYKNTQTEDLWDALEEVSGKPIRSVMSTWTKQKGFPIITVTSKQNGNVRVLSLTQEKYSLGDSDDKTLWKIPVSFSTSANPNTIAKKILFESKSIEIQLENVSSDQWVKLNPGVVEFYRVNYSKEMLNQLMSTIANQSIGPLDRLNIQDDLFALVCLGQVSTSSILTLLQAYSIETNYTVWCSINACISTLRQLVSHLDLLPQFNTFCQQLFSKIHLKLGWDPIPGESHLDTMLRNLILVQLIHAKDEKVIAEAKKKFEDHISGLKTISADIRSSLYRGTLTGCDEKTFDRVIQLYKDTELHEEKNRIAAALGSVPSKELLEKVLEFSLSDNVRSQSSVTFMVAVSLSSVGRDITWKFIKDKIEFIRERYENLPMASRLFKYATENFASDEKAKEVEEFFSKHPVKGTDRAIQQAIETIKLNAKWLNRDKDDIKKFLLNCQ